MMLVAGLFVRDAAADALVRWQPSNDPTIVGYNVYVRPAGGMYSTPRQAGLSGRAADGTHTFRVTQLPPATTWYFAVAAYGADGTEGRLSNEVALGPTDPCVLDQCYAKTSCVILPVPDGLPCADAAADPCSELCSAGVCGAAPRSQLTTGRLLLAQGTHGVRLGGTASVPASVGADLAGSGIAVRIEGAGGGVVYDTYLAPESLKGGANGVSFRYRAPRGTTAGLLRLSTRRSGDVIRVSVRAVVDGLTTDGLPDQLRWMLSVGAQCASHVDMACNRGSGRMSCS